MSIFVVGGDHLGNIPHKLGQRGFDRVQHFPGRKVRKVKEGISPSLDLILILTDYVGTDLSRVIKEEAKKHKVKLAFSRRSWASISQALNSIEDKTTEKK